MGRTSTIKRLPKPVREAVDRALAGGATIDEVVAKLAELGHPTPRSTVGRYSKRLKEVGEKIRQSREMADALVAEIGPGAVEGKTGRLLVEILQNITFKYLMGAAEGDKTTETPKDLSHLGRALKDMAAAVSIDADRELRIRREVALGAAKVVKGAGQKAGLSKEAIAAIERDILGIVR